VVVLDGRIDRRVDEMLQAGLVEELIQFHRQYNEQQLRDSASVKLLLTVSFLFFFSQNINFCVIC